MSNFTLEKHKFFPLIAWTLSIGFALFVGNLSLQLYGVTSELANRNAHLEEAVQENSTRLDSLEELLEELE